MTLYKRNWNCAVCNKPVIWDSEAKTLSCACKTQTNVTFVSMEAFTPLPKYDRRIFNELVTVPIDSAKFLDREAETLYISDRDSLNHGNENPMATLGWIYYPKGDKIQLCLTVKGRFHKEKIAYNTKDMDNWEYRMWIRFPPEVLPKLIAFLQRDPQKLASWC